MNDTRSHSLKFEAEFFRKSNNLTLTREKKIRSIQMRTVHILLLLLLALLVAFVVYKTSVLLLEWDTLQVHSYRLRQQPVFAADQVREILKRCRGNILALDLKELRAQLLRLPEIEDATISRVLPDTVEIGFRLRQPLFSLARNGGFQLLDASGLVLGERPVAPPGLIPIRAEGPVPAQIAAAAQELLPLRDRIEYVAYAEPYGIELKLRTGPEVFYPGAGDFLKKINRYTKIKPHLAADGPAIRSVDLRISGRIYFGFGDGPQGES
ncbi:MAG: FtsQ-type POTRA domain-containing protein [Candidatus Aminicenantes bacterium]|nr:FtsQ-type POTRA domain-containing protein [Candidatus Aminicenantes bacterium]